LHNLRIARSAARRLGRSLSAVALLAPHPGWLTLQFNPPFQERISMATFVVLTDSANDSQIAVNLDQIRFVRPSSDGTSIIYFDNDQSLPVKESRENIARLSAKANWA
jgi:hypothetical protein